MISIFKRVPLLGKLVQKSLEMESEFLLNNRQFVLSSYRYLLKTIPTLYTRKLQQKQKYNELQFVFRNQKMHESLAQTRFKSQKLREIIQNLKKNDTSDINQFQIALYSQTEDLKYQLYHDYEKKYTQDQRKHKL